MSFSFFAFDSRFFWEDVYNYNDWIIQLNVRTLKYRLVDEPDVTVLDQGGVTLRITSVYAFTLEGEPEDSPVGYRVGFSLVSKREKPVHLFLRCVGINGRCDSMDYIHIYSEFDKKAEVTF